jgi:23S rRNA (adenine2503-C2)-methyltransferase
MESSQNTDSTPPVVPLIHSLSQEEILAFCREAKQPSYRADQIWHWLYVQNVSDWAQMKNLPASLRSHLAERFALASVSEMATEGESQGTRKILAGLRDGERIEEVLIPADDRRTVCISSQVGCRFHCAFCASGQAGFRRNLEIGEIVGQVLLAWRGFGEKPTHVVVMGIGEPFDNYDAVLKAVRIVNDQEGLCIGARRITLSTAGVIPGISRLADEGLQVELSVSLHAPSDGLRSELMPINRKYPLPSLLKACEEYFKKTKRLITFEYTLIENVNDQPQHAKELARLLSPFPCRVNFILLSPVVEFAGAPSSDSVAERFIQALDKVGINATLRASRGTSVNAACGQLRSRHEEV